MTKTFDEEIRSLGSVLRGDHLRLTEAKQAPAKINDPFGRRSWTMAEAMLDEAKPKKKAKTKTKSKGGESLEDMNGRIAVFARTQGNVISSYLNRYRSASVNEGATDPETQRVLAIMMQMESLVGELKKITA